MTIGDVPKREGDTSGEPAPEINPEISPTPEINPNSAPELPEAGLEIGAGESTPASTPEGTDSPAVIEQQPEAVEAVAPQGSAEQEAPKESKELSEVEYAARKEQINKLYELRTEGYKILLEQAFGDEGDKAGYKNLNDILDNPLKFPPLKREVAGRFKASGDDINNQKKRLLSELEAEKAAVITRELEKT